jgi:tetratricopeptide (TPR) repeat protein
MAKSATFALLFLAFACSLLSGCARFRSEAKPNYRTVEHGSARNPQRAKKKHEKGLSYLRGCCNDLAEQSFQEALICDDSFGPAHNSLGKLYYDQGKYYLSAWEFEHAIKEMPDRAEPVNNLGLVFEAVGQMAEAITQYQKARELDSENAQYLGNYLRARMKQGEHSSMMRNELEELILLDDRAEWVRWAKLKLTTDRTSQDWQHPAPGIEMQGVSPPLLMEPFTADPLPFESNVISTESPLVQPDAFSESEINDFIMPE